MQFRLSGAWRAIALIAWWPLAAFFLTMPRKAKYTPYHLTHAEAQMVRGGRRGGKRTLKRYGVEHMRAIGKRGGAVYVARYVKSGRAGLAAMSGDEDAIAFVKAHYTPPPTDDDDDPDENDDYDE
jgi:hypothetical protein